MHGMQSANIMVNEIVEIDMLLELDSFLPVLISFLQLVPFLMHMLSADAQLLEPIPFKK
jgi:hypothetical protein